MESTWAHSLESILSEWWGVPGLVSMLKSEKASVRLEAVKALSTMGEQAEPAIPDLIIAIDDKDFWVGRTAIDALGAIGQKAKAAVPKIIEKMTDDRYYNAELALRHITGQDLGKDAAVWKQWWEAQP